VNKNTVLKREESILRQKSYAFALRIVKLSQHLTEKKEYIINRQITKSGTAIGALIREAEFAQSTADFISKESIGLKEANETDYWLSLLKDAGYIDEPLYTSLASNCNELIAMLVSTIKTSKLRVKRGE
jgi:four helix bundle protein